LVLGGVTVYKLVRRSMRAIIWRLRNRLIVAYLFIAVVPIVLIVLLVAGTSYVVVGQMAVYLVNTALNSHVRALTFPADAMSRVPASSAETAMKRYGPGLQRNFPNFEMLVTGDLNFRYPPDSALEQPPKEWKHASGLVIRKKDGKDQLCAWAHAGENGNEVTIVAPVTHELLTELVQGIGAVNVMNLTVRSKGSRVPPAANALDFAVTFPYPIPVAQWDAPRDAVKYEVLVVDTRLSTVLDIVFGQRGKWSELALTVLIVVSGLFLLVETASLWAGVKLSRSITGAVHELYEGTQHVRQGDFAYRIAVKGDDQLAELGTSFNSMTENLGQLIVVAKEKERLESELTIAREVQNQLFPKDVPFTRSLELKGVCNPARMVSGDYYDFMALPNDALAFAIGDVAGKGISAALLMATIQSTMRTQLGAVNGNGHHPFSAAKLVSNLNRQLYATTAPEKYATFYFAMYEDATHSLTYTNAGHLAPMLLRGSQIQMLDSTGTVVGAFPIARYQEKTVALEHGDLLVAYTDGVTEPENVYGEMFGEDRLKDMLIKYAKSDSSELIARTMEAVIHWTGSSELQDDMTMVVARRL
ncbi:MAG TPA: SpoIIE family protein phosphatase, partial [Candidatus Solibacter sp.]|nr:SpoIIE family protein phosphatase [Candidatus Solibacter sp.]